MGKRKFVVQEHKVGGHVHWDLMLEAGVRLETFRVGVPAEEICEERVAMTRIFDHDLKFLSYEGSVNDGKGSVRICDRGDFEIIFAKDNLREVEFFGEKICGKFMLKQIEGDTWEIWKS